MTTRAPWRAVMRDPLPTRRSRHTDRDFTADHYVERAFNPSTSE